MAILVKSVLLICNGVELESLFFKFINFNSEKNFLQ